MNDFHQSMLQHAKKVGFYRPNNYYVSFNLNPIISNISNPSGNAANNGAGHRNIPYKSRINGIPDEISYMCKEVVVPSKMIGEVQTKTRPGSVIRVATNEVFDQQITMSYYCSPDMRERVFFERWMSMVVDPITRVANYWEEYAKDNTITIWFLPRTNAGLVPTEESKNLNTGQPLYYIKLNHCFPSSIDKSNLSYNSGDVFQIDVTITFFDSVSGVNDDFLQIYQQQQQLREQTNQRILDINRFGNTLT